MNASVPATGYDYVVVGGGTAGCVLASRLSEDPQATVLLVEAGGDERRRDVETPDLWSSLLGSDADWGYETVVQPTTGRSYPAARGKVLGGSGSINCMVHLRGHRADFDAWSAGGAHGWDFESVLPYFQRCEDVPDGDPRYRGRGGPLTPRPLVTEDPVGSRFVAGAEQAGHERVTDFNSASMLGAGFPDSLILNGIRETTASAYLRPAMGRPNLTVHTSALVQRLIVERGTCTGVEYRQGDRLHRVAAAAEVVLSAGAIGSTHLLLLSGIGPADELSELDIATVADVPEVGLNLQDHLLLAGIRYRSEASLPPAHMGLATVLARTDDGDHGPDLHVAVVNSDYHQDWQESLPDSFAFIVGHMRPHSRGSVRLASADPAVAPVIDPRYFSEAHDVDQMIAGIELVHQIVLTGTFDDLGGASQTASMLKLDREELRRFVRDAASSYFHLAGTCRMGSDAGAVVDPQLRVAGVDRLRVADASVMPRLVSSNSNAATIMIAEKAADLVRGRWEGANGVATR